MRPGAAVTAAAVFAIAACFAPAVSAYAADPYYQAHFLFLWLFFAAALWRTGRAWQARSPWDRRTAGAIAIAALGAGALYVGLATGSSTVQRVALVLAFAAALVGDARGLSTARCASFAAFALLCFGVPYSAYFALTQCFRASFAWILAGLPEWTPLAYRVDGTTLSFDHFELAITEDCAGFHQVLTFLGIASVAAVTGRLGWRRAFSLFGAGALLSYGSAFGRVLLFVVLVQAGRAECVLDPDLHAALGFAAYAPFLAAFLALALRLHRPLELAAPAPVARRALPALVLLLPFAAARVWPSAEPPDLGEAPSFPTAATPPPGYALAARAESEAREREVYGTPWLVNARFVGASPEQWCELFAYVTRDRRHLAVHRVANCLVAAGEDVRYGPAVDVGGRRFWSFELRGTEDIEHGFFAFRVEGVDFDDSWSTQWQVFRRRLAGGAREVGLSRILLPGPLSWPLAPRDKALLAWRAAALGAERFGN